MDLKISKAAAAFSDIWLTPHQLIHLCEFMTSSIKFRLRIMFGRRTQIASFVLR